MHQALQTLCRVETCRHIHSSLAKFLFTAFLFDCTSSQHLNTQMAYQTTHFSMVHECITVFCVVLAQLEKLVQRVILIFVESATDKRRLAVTLAKIDMSVK